ncbi:MAG: hypothetical protein AAGA48_00815 [Myxococcota bacterium]
MLWLVLAIFGFAVVQAQEPPDPKALEEFRSSVQAHFAAHKGSAIGELLDEETIVATALRGLESSSGVLSTFFGESGESIRLQYLAGYEATPLPNWPKPRGTWIRFRLRWNGGAYEQLGLLPGHRRRSAGGSVCG